MHIIAIFVLLQVVIGAVAVFVLVRLLDKELIEAALERLQAVSAAELFGPVHFKTARPLNPEHRGRIQSIFKRKAVQGKIIFEENLALKGGLLIAYNDQVLDFSLSSRLQKLWS